MTHPLPQIIALIDNKEIDAAKKLLDSNIEIKNSDPTHPHIILQNAIGTAPLAEILEPPLQDTTLVQTVLLLLAIKNLSIINEDTWPYFWTYFLKTIEYGQLEIVNLWLNITEFSQNIDPIQIFDYGDDGAVTFQHNMALETAVRYGHLEIVNALLGHNAIVKNIAANNNWILCTAIQHGYINICTKLLEYRAVRENIAKNPVSPLVVAIKAVPENIAKNPVSPENNHIKIIRTLLTYSEVLTNLEAFNHWVFTLAAKKNQWAIMIINMLLEARGNNLLSLPQNICWDYDAIISHLEEELSKPPHSLSLSSPGLLFRQPSTEISPEEEEDDDEISVKNSNHSSSGLKPC
jgi:hypothetical protein